MEENWRKIMKKKIILLVITTLLITTTTIPVLANTRHSGFFGEKNSQSFVTNDVTLDVALTTDYVDDYGVPNPRVREFELDQNVYAYVSVSSDNLLNVKITHVWWYDNGTGLQNKWSWSYTIPEPWTSCWTYTYWAIGLDYGKGVGYIEVLADDTSIGQSNWYAIDNTQPNKPTITGDATGKVKKPLDYNFTGIDPDGFKLSYFVDWGDNTTTEWTEFTDSGVPIILSHTWNKKGTYTIKCKVKDLAENESDWAELSIKIPVSIHIPAFIYLEKLLQRFPHAFPVLRHLFGY